MGISGLETYLEETGGSPSPYFYPVSIPELCQSHPNPVIIVDLVVCMRKMYLEVGGLDPICGGQHQEYLKIWSDFIQRFKDLNIRLIFVYDGMTREEKIGTWIKRRYNALSRYGYPVFDDLKRSVYPSVALLKKDHPEFKVSLPSLQTEQILKEVLKCQVIKSTEREADEEIAILARTHNAVAILSQDTDFVIYDTPALYLSVRHLEVDSLKTYCYDRFELASSLGIHSNQLALLSLMKGNDLIPQSELKRFHFRILRHKGRYQTPPGMRLSHSVIKRLAKFITEEQLPWNYEDIMKDLPNLVSSIFHHFRHLSTAETLINGYFLIDQQSQPENLTGDNDQEWNKIVSHFSPLSSQITSIMKGGSFQSSFTLEDYRLSHEIPPVSLLWVKFRTKFYGILLFEKPGARDLEEPDKFKIRVPEMCFSGSGSIDEYISRTIQAPPFPHAGLVRLSSCDRSLELEETRWKMFAWCLSPSLDWKLLSQLPSSQLYLFCQLYYMQNESENGPILYDWEVQVFILTKLILPKKSLEDLNAMGFPPNIPDPRGVHLATVFCRSPLIQILYVLNLPVRLADFLHLNNFNGKLFQWIYLEMKYKWRDAFKLIQEYDLDAEVFNKLYNVITRNGLQVRSAYPNFTV